MNIKVHTRLGFPLFFAFVSSKYESPRKKMHLLTVTPGDDSAQSNSTSQST